MAYDFQFSGSTRQIAACVVASLPTFLGAVVLAWPSPVITYMTTGRAPVLLSTYETSWMISCIDFGNFFIAVPVSKLMDRMGRKFTVNLSPPLMFAGWMFILFGRQVWCLFVARLIHGAVVSIGFVVPGAYIGEMADVRIRGQLCLMVQLSYALGMLFSYTGGWLLNDYTALALAGTGVSIVSGVLMLMLPESPYFLMLDGRPAEAASCLRRLRNYTEDELRAELITVEKSVLNTRCKGNFRDLLTRDRWPFTIVMVLAVLQMASGASVLEVYAASVVGGPLLSATACSVVLGLVILAAIVPFLLTVDSCGRRPLMLVSCLGTAAFYAATATCLEWRRFGGADQLEWPLLASVAGAQFFINIGIMPLLYIVQCEYFPSDTRALADAVTLMIVTLTSAVMINSYPLVVGAFGDAANFVVYATAALVGCAFCYAYMPETKNKSFVDIQLEFRRLDAKKRDYQSI